MLSVIVNKSVCPSCSATRQLSIALPLFAGCVSCGCVYFVDKEKVTTKTDLKAMPVQPFSIISVGTKGKYKGTEFEVIGHIRSIGSGAISNEWLMKMATGLLLWLCECGFNYSVFDPRPVKLTQDHIRHIKAGEWMSVENKDYTVTDLSKQVEFQMEGQLPEECFNNEPYFEYNAIDIKDKGLLSVCIFDKNTIEGFRGQSISLNSLELSGMDKFKSWI
ncbi:MAG: DUF4178 domain-containing protein [Bacteroidia bacterium]